MDVIARTMAFVEVLVAAQVQEIEFVNQAVALEQVKGAVNGDAVDAGINFLRAFQYRSGVQVAFRIVHDFEEDFSLACEADPALFEGGLEPAWALVRVDALAGRDSMCGWGRHGG